MGGQSAAQAGIRPWWPLVEPTPRWVRVRIGEALIADSRRALLHVQYGPGALPRSFLPTYYFPMDDIVSGVLADRVRDRSGLTVWAVQAAGQRASDAAWMHSSPAAPLDALSGKVTFTWQDPLSWYEEEEPLFAHARDPHRGRIGQGDRWFPHPTSFLGDYSGLAAGPAGVVAMWTDMRANVCFGTRCGSGEGAEFASS